MDGLRSPNWTAVLMIEIYVLILFFKNNTSMVFEVLTQLLHPWLKYRLWCFFLNYSSMVFGVLTDLKYMFWFFLFFLITLRWPLESYLNCCTHDWNICFDFIFKQNFCGLWSRSWTAVFMIRVFVLVTLFKEHFGNPRSCKWSIS